MTRAALIAAVLTLLATPATTQALSDHDITAALKASPCYGQPVTILWDPALQDQGLGATASGAHYTDETETAISFDRCEITRNPTDWAGLSRSERCMEDLHELLHLAGRLHESSGVMAHRPEDRGWLAGCHTLRERVVRDLEALTPPGAQVLCGKWQGGHRAFTCLATWASDDGRSFERRYRVRVRGELYAIRRVRSRRYAR